MQASERLLARRKHASGKCFSCMRSMLVRFKSPLTADLRLLRSLAGLPIAFMSGFCVAASRLGAPDAGLLSYGEVLDQGRNIVKATRALPIIGDADTG